MTLKTTTASKKTEKPEPKTPTYRAYHVVQGGEGQKSRWNPIGAFFAHEDELGGTLVLDLLPINFDGRIVLRAIKAAEE